MTQSTPPVPSDERSAPERCPAWSWAGRDEIPCEKPAGHRMPHRHDTGASIVSWWDPPKRRRQ